MSTILFVENNNDIREAYAELISVLGYDCLLAKDGQDALAILEATECDLILSDVEMPYINGQELLRQIKADPQKSHIPVVLFTVTDHEKLRRELSNVEPDGILPKPVSITQLRATFERLL